MARSPRHTPTFIYGPVALFPLLGTLALWWRDELRLDLASRQYVRRRAFWPSVRMRRGSLDELDAVVLARDAYRSTNEAASLDRPVVAERGRVEPGVDPSSPPPGSGIEVTGSRGERVIVLPRIPLQPAGLFLVVFGAVFGGFALFALAAALGAVPMKVSGNRDGLGVIASVFTVICFGIAALPFLAASAREGVREAGDDIVFSTRLLGGRVGVKRIARREVEEIDVRPDALPHEARAGVAVKEEAFVRSDQTIARIGRELTPEGKRCLARRAADFRARVSRLRQGMASASRRRATSPAVAASPGAVPKT